MKVLICGSRYWTDGERIEGVLRQLIDVGEWPVVIHGGARGADSLADAAARKLGLTTKVFPADWDGFGKAAGPMRNAQMVAEKPDLVLAFHEDIGNSRGTHNLIRQACKADLPVVLIEPNGPVVRWGALLTDEQRERFINEAWRNVWRRL